MSRLVIGVGFRKEASARSIGEAVTTATASAAIPGAASVLAVLEDKAAHPGLIAAARTMQLAIETISAGAIGAADVRVATRSEQARKYRGVGSVCEATALAAAGEGARLLVTRIVSTDRKATAAIALVEDTAP